MSRFNLTFSMNLIEHIIFSYNMSNLSIKTGSGICRNMFKCYFMSVGHAAGAFFSPKKSTFPEFLEIANFQKHVFVKQLIFLIIIGRDIL